VLADSDDPRCPAHQGLRERLAGADRQRSDQLDGGSAKAGAGTWPDQARISRRPLVAVDRIGARLLRVGEVLVRREAGCDRETIGISAAAVDAHVDHQRPERTVREDVVERRFEYRQARGEAALLDVVVERQDPEVAGCLVDVPVLDLVVAERAQRGLEVSPIGHAKQRCHSGATERLEAALDHSIRSRPQALKRAVDRRGREEGVRVAERREHLLEFPASRGEVSPSPPPESRWSRSSAA
jgi:hypothetical protein